TDTSTGDVSAETAGNTFATAADVATELNKKFGAGDIKDITSSNKTVTVSQASLEENNVDLKVNVGGTLSVDKATGAINVADDAITTDKLKDGNVTKDKLSQPVQDTLDKVGAGEVAKNDTNTVTGAKVHTAVEAAKESVEADGADAGLTVTKEAVAGKGTKFKVKLDDATKAQLKKEETVSTTDTNLTVDGSATNASGAKDFKLGLAKDLVIDSIGKSATGAKLTLGEDAITLSKGTKPV
ncbi:hypothetical protein QJU83_10180, partial [Pasteurella skyensis]|uniref:hypothetical protein n=1 Tax=Phocoenobacter skyensis TaxID=97481 RepID=UPI00274578C5